MTFKAPFEVAIIGGGISGLVLAIGLQQRNVPVKIYEQASHFGEIGAGVAFGPNARRAMKFCSEAIHDGFKKVSTQNQSPEKQETWFDFLDGYSDYEVGKEKHLFTLGGPTAGANAVHRAHFLDEMVKLIPEGTAHFHKHLDTIEELENGKMQMKFHDGSDAQADAGMAGSKALSFKAKLAK